MINKEIIEMIEDTDREYQEYCDSRRCLRDECALLKNEEDIDCQILFTFYKFGIDQKELINVFMKFSKLGVKPWKKLKNLVMNLFIDTSAL